MSEVFDGVLSMGSVSEFRSAIARMINAPALTICELGPNIVAAAIVAGRHEEIPWNALASLASNLSTQVGPTLAVQYNTQTSERASAVFEQGRQVRRFGAEDEIYVELDSVGKPKLQGQRFHESQLDPEKEYETVLNAVQLGLEHLNITSTWRDFRKFISLQR